MTDQEINIAIAQACGKLRRVMTDEEWKLRYKKWCAEPDDPHAEITCPSTHEGTVPDYCNDLNAMHEAEEHLSGLFLADYFCLIERTGKAAGVRATAGQRAEAFLRCKGLWREAK